MGLIDNLELLTDYYNNIRRVGNTTILVETLKKIEREVVFVVKTHIEISFMVEKIKNPLVHVVSMQQLRTFLHGRKIPILFDNHALSSFFMELLEWEEASSQAFSNVENQLEEKDSKNREQQAILLELQKQLEEVTLRKNALELILNLREERN